MIIWIKKKINCSSGLVDEKSYVWTSNHKSRNTDTPSALITNNAAFDDLPSTSKHDETMFMPEKNNNININSNSPFPDPFLNDGVGLIQEWPIIIDRAFALLMSPNVSDTEKSIPVERNK